MDDLGHGESLKLEVTPMQDSTLGNRGMQIRFASLEGGDELMEEERYAVIDLSFYGGGTDLVATFSVQRLMISSRWTAMNSCSMLLLRSVRIVYRPRVHRCSILHSSARCCEPATFHQPAPRPAASR